MQSLYGWIKSRLLGEMCTKRQVNRGIYNLFQPASQSSVIFYSGILSHSSPGITAKAFAECRVTH